MICLLTVFIGIAIASAGSLGTVRIAGLGGITVSGGVGVVVIILGVLGVGC